MLVFWHYRFVVFFSVFCLFPFLIFAAHDDSVLQRRGKGKVQIVKGKNGGWQIFVEGEPYLIKGVVYDPIRIGDRLFSSNEWMNYDFNNNGINDVAYEAWVDENGNNIQDLEEKAIGDFTLMQAMGVNTLRIYHPTNIKKEILRDLYERFGIRVIMGNFLGAYCWGSGADWNKGTDYWNGEQCYAMMEDVKKMVREYKDEPYVLMWLLGNENDVKGRYENSTYNNTNAAQYPKQFARFVNKVIRYIHSVDPNHPVGVSNATYRLLPYYKKYTPDLDFIAFNSYEGPYGFPSVFRIARYNGDWPVVITEYGGDSYDQRKMREDQDYQVVYHRGAWKDIVRNSGVNGGICLGGCAYLWVDNWWFCGKADVHDTKTGAWQGSIKDGWFNDEWLGICSQGNGKNSPFMRQLKKVYYFYKEEWNKDQCVSD